MNTYYVYLLISKRNNKYISYVGYTNNLDDRIKLHNSSKGAKFTRGRIWKIIYKKCYKSKSVAMQNEYKIKHNTSEVWANIITSGGSVQHLPFLEDSIKDVFKTSFELDQNWVIKHAADRQKYVCQGQSVNLFFPSGSDKSYVNNVHIQAWRGKLKGLYYLRTSASSNAENVGKQVERVALKDFMEDSECLACSG